MVADERSRCRRATVGRSRVIVILEPQHDRSCSDEAPRVSGDGVVERKIELVWYPPLALVLALFDRLDDPRLAENLEVLDAGFACDGQYLRHPAFVELAVDVPGGVDAEPVELEAGDPTTEHFGETVDHFRFLGVQVIETAEVSLLDACLATATPVDVATVVVVRRVVHPCGLLEVRFRRQHECLVRRRRLFDEPAATHEHDHVSGVVHDDVEIHLHVQRVRAVDERLQVFLGPESRVDGGEVDAPVTVVRRAVTLHRSLHDERRDPDAREAEVGQTLQPGLRVGAAARQPLQVTAVKEPDVGRVEARHFSLPGDEAGVVGRIPVRVTVGHHEVDHSRREV